MLFNIRICQNLWLNTSKPNFAESLNISLNSNCVIASDSTNNKISFTVISIKKYHFHFVIHRDNKKNPQHKIKTQMITPTPTSSSRPNNNNSNSMTSPK